MTRDTIELPDGEVVNLRGNVDALLEAEAIAREHVNRWRKALAAINKALEEAPE